MAEETDAPVTILNEALVRARARIEELESALAGVLEVAQALVRGEPHPFTMENIARGREVLQKGSE